MRILRSTTALILSLSLLAPGNLWANVAANISAGVKSAGVSVGAAGAAGAAAHAPLGSLTQSANLSLGLPVLPSLRSAPGVAATSYKTTHFGDINPVPVKPAGFIDARMIQAAEHFLAEEAATQQAASRASPAAESKGLFAGLKKKFAKLNKNSSRYSMSSEPWVDLIVMFDGSAKPIKQDIHLSLVEAHGRYAALHMAMAIEGLYQEVEGAGVDAETLAAFQAKPIAAYKRINAATIRLSASKAEAFKKIMESRHHQVFANEKRELVRPIEDDPNYGRHNLPKSAVLSMPDTLKLSTADKVLDIGRERWGAPSALKTMFRRVLVHLGLDIPQPKVAVLDTGADTKHQLLKAVKAVKNMSSGQNVDDNGHGSWVTSMLLWFAPWNRNLTHYKIFSNGSTTLDNILKALTTAGNDGNIIMSNSWGSSYGNPASPDSQLVKKLAEEGRIMVFAAGNSGNSGKNTIGSPSIVHYRDAKTGAMRVLAVAATDRDKVVTGFSSKGPGSRVTARGGEWEGYPNKPDVAEQGENTEAAWPTNMRGDRVDPELGNLRAISGTSMSTPKLAGEIALLASLFGVTEVGEKLDMIVNAVMKTLSNEHNQAATAIGEGYSEVYAAYQELEKMMTPAVPGKWAAKAIRQHAQPASETVRKPNPGEVEKIVDEAFAFHQKMLMLGLLSVMTVAVGIAAWIGAGMLIELLAQWSAAVEAWIMSGGGLPF
ncbi:MAG: S8 family serine peptidase [Elusimicrobiota bacterium]